MSEVVNEYQISRMTACLEGRVPDTTSYQELILRDARVKVLDSLGNVQYGYMYSFSPRARSFSIRVPAGVLPKDSIVTYSMDTHKVYHAFDLDSFIPRALDTVVVINQQFYTIVDNRNEQFPIWVGPGNRVYYSEDIQTLIKLHGECTVLI